MQGTVASNCAKPDLVDQALAEGNVIVVRILATQSATAVCEFVETSFNETYALDTANLTSGSYTIHVNDATGSFSFTLEE